MSKGAERIRPPLLVLTSTLPRWTGDPEPRFVLDLARTLSSRFEPVILAPMAPDAAPREEMEGIEVVRFRYAPVRAWERLASPGAILPNLRARPWLLLLVPAFFLSQLLALRKLIRARRFDAIHCHWIVPQGLTVSLCSLTTDLPPVLLTCHGADAFTLNTLWMRRTKRWILRKARRVTVVSREIAALLTDRVDPTLYTRCRHIPMGVDLALFGRHGARKRSETATVLFAGRLTEKKGVEHLIRAVALSPLRDRDMRLRIVGEGPLRLHLEGVAHSLGVADRVTFVGAVPHRQLAAHMAEATVFCLPSIIARSGDREGMPTVLLEAAAASLPIVASDVGGCSDLIETGRSGWLIGPADEQAMAIALIEAIDEPELAERMAFEARQRASEYAWDRIGERYAAALDEVLDGERRGARPV